MADAKVLDYFINKMLRHIVAETVFYPAFLFESGIAIDVILRAVAVDGPF